jgi:hypothetical protein
MWMTSRLPRLASVTDAAGVTAAIPMDFPERITGVTDPTGVRRGWVLPAGSRHRHLKWPRNSVGTRVISLITPAGTTVFTYGRRMPISGL